MLSSRYLAVDPTDAQTTQRCRCLQWPSTAAFLSPLVERFGGVQAGRGVFVAGNGVLRADPGRRVCLGSATNIRDNVFVLALSDRAAVHGTCARHATQTGRRTSLAHQAEIINSRIGEFTFIGFRARVLNAVVDDGAFILHGAVVRNVRSRRDRIVGIGQRVTTQATANALPRKQEAQADFQREVLEVNKEFAEGYGDLYRHRGHGAVTGISLLRGRASTAGCIPRSAAAWSASPSRASSATCASGATRRSAAARRSERTKAPRSRRTP